MPDDEELINRARLLAEATGRDFEDVIVDLADDGILNESNKEDANLITQLKQAAELMSAVQNINKEVSENTVLNGGDNKTEVSVDTTLEGDIVDRAIASAHRKVVELKKIAIIIIPVLLLITGGTMSNMGMFGSDEEPDEPPMIEYLGCTDWNAMNYDEYANMDDDSCEYYIYGCTNDAAPNYDDQATFDDGSCEPEPEPIRGCMDSEAENYDPEAEEDNGSCEYPPDPIKGCTDPEAENFDNEAEEDDGSCEYPPPPCEGKASFYNASYSIEYNNTANSSLANLTVFWDADWSCDEIQMVEIDIYLKFNNTVIHTKTRIFNLNGDSSFVANYTIYDIAVGKTYEVCLTAWVDRDENYDLDDEYNQTVNVS